MSSTACYVCAIEETEVQEFWIQCDCCQHWLHGRCDSIEEYESAVIDKYFCPKCVSNTGRSRYRLKSHQNDHRYDFDLPNQEDLPVQIGTKRFIEEFKVTQLNFPRIDSCQIIYASNGYDLKQKFDRNNIWTKLYIINESAGLEMKMPPDYFDIEELIELIGETKSVNTIDVYRQHTYHMSLASFRKLWQPQQRPRLYNIISLEVSQSSLSKMVSPPAIVADLSWVHRFWPDSTQHSADANTSEDHLRSKPEVSLFCLIGMKDSYTDFHIDFGGSSVWYHVFKGKKVFYLVEPTNENLRRYTEYQKMSNRSEHFFGEFLPEDSVSRVELNKGQTLMIPSGWIHAVWTPVDSIIFGGNFVHSLAVSMQLRIYGIEWECNTDERLMLPSFELVNWYAAKSIFETIKDRNEDDKIIDNYLLNGAYSLLPALKKWYKVDKRNKKWQYYPEIELGNIIQKLQRELNAYEKRHKCSNSMNDIKGKKTVKNHYYKKRKHEHDLKLKLILGVKSKLVVGEKSESVVNDDDDKFLSESSPASEGEKVEKITIRLPCRSTEIVEDEEEEKLALADVAEETLTVAAMFGVSSHGRIQKPTAWVAEAKQHIHIDDGSAVHEAGKATAKKIPPQMILMAAKVAEQEEREMMKMMKKSTAKQEMTTTKKMPKKPRRMSTTKQRLATKLNMRRMMPHL